MQGGPGTTYFEVLALAGYSRFLPGCGPSEVISTPWSEIHVLVRLCSGY